MQIALVGLSIDPNDKYCAPTTSPGKSNALMEVTWTNDSDRAAKLPGTTIDMNASADPGSSFLADSIRFRPCGLGVGTSSTPLEPGQQAMEVNLTVTEPMGMETLVYFQLQGITVCGKASPDVEAPSGKPMQLTAKLQNMHLIDDESGLVL